MTANSHFITPGIKATRFPVLSGMVVRVRIQEEVTVKTLIAYSITRKTSYLYPKRDLGG